MTRAIRLACLSVLGLALAATAAAAPKPTRIPVTPKDIADSLGTDWYGIYMNKTKIGYLMLALTEVEGGYRASVEVEFKTVIDGQRVTARVQEVQDFQGHPPYRFYWGSCTETEGDQVRRVRVAVREDGTAIAQIQEAGQSRQRELGGLDFTLGDFMGDEVWIRRRRGVGDTFTSTSFDVSDLRTDTQTLVIRSVRSTTAQGVKVTWYEVKVSSGRSGEIGTARVDTQGRLLSIVMGPMMEARLEPEAIAKKTEFGTDPFVLGQAKIDKPLGHPLGIQTLVLQVGGKGAARIPNGPWQAIAADTEGGTYTLTLGAGAGKPSKATPEEIAEATSETAAFPCRHPKAVALAKRAVRKAKTPQEKVQALVEFVDTYVVDSYNADTLSVMDTIARKKGDCTEHAALFVTLARAAGIPARELHGLVYMDDEACAFGGHAWCEVVLDGMWRPVDPTMGADSITATHISFGHGDRGANNHMRAMGEVTFKLLKLQRVSCPATRPD